MKVRLTFFRNKRFMLEEITWANCFIICNILYIRKPKVAFSISCYFIFSLMNAPVYVLVNTPLTSLVVIKEKYMKWAMWRSQICCFFALALVVIKHLNHPQHGPLMALSRMSTHFDVAVWCSLYDSARCYSKIKG